MIANHDIEEAKQLAHTGNDLDFFGLADFVEALGKDLDDGIESHGGDGGHVEHGADGCSSSTNGPFPFHRSRIVVVGGNADEGADASSAGSPQFLEFGQECGADDGADTGD